MHIKFVPRDIWIGLYIAKNDYAIKEEPLGRGKYTEFYWTFYLCIIPMFPIIWRVVRYRTWTSQYHKNV